MFPFWKPVLAPVLAAAEARRVVEIGALRGDNTREIIETLGPDAVLHVVDPVPGFDPTEHEAEFPGRYVFHQALSLDVLGGLALAPLALAIAPWLVRGRSAARLGVAQPSDLAQPVETRIEHDIG